MPRYVWAHIFSISTANCTYVVEIVAVIPSMLQQQYLNKSHLLRQISYFRDSRSGIRLHCYLSNLKRALQEVSTDIRLTNKKTYITIAEITLYPDRELIQYKFNVKIKLNQILEINYTVSGVTRLHEAFDSSRG